jgi:hypothetical protein
MALKSLNDEKEIILQADKGNCTVVHKQGEGNRSTEILVNEILRKDFTSQIERKIRKLTKHKTILPAALKHKLTPHDSKPSHLCGLPEMH